MEKPLGWELGCLDSNSVGSLYAVISWPRGTSFSATVRGEGWAADPEAGEAGCSYCDLYLSPS